MYAQRLLPQIYLLAWSAFTIYLALYLPFKFTNFQFAVSEFKATPHRVWTTLCKGGSLVLALFMCKFDGEFPYIQVHTHTHTVCLVHISSLELQRSWSLLGLRVVANCLVFDGKAKSKRVHAARPMLIASRRAGKALGERGERVVGWMWLHLRC